MKVYSKFFSIFFLGFSAGVPFALTASVLSTWLADIGINKSSIGLFSLVAVPYSFKYLWAPFIDGLKLPILNKLGHRKGWLILTQILIMLSILFMSSLDPLNQLTLCAVTALVITFLSATQDIVIDALRIEYLPVSDQGIGAASYSYGYRIALYVSGALPLIIASFFSWHAAYFVAGLFMIVGMLTTLMIKEPYEYSTRKTKHFFHDMILAPCKNFAAIPGWYFIIVFIILFKLGDAMAGIMTTPFLLDIGFSKIEIVAIVKTWGLITTFIGLTIGGILVKKVNFKKSILIAGVLQMLSNLMFVYQNHVGHNDHVLIATISVENLTSGIGATVIIAYLSSLCSIKFAATQYALLSSIITLSRNVLSGSSGFIVDSYGWNVFFIVSVIAAIPALLLIPKLHTFEKHRQ
jgi:MFS transporter, PAT family, beta-lactamase induction signal transducer AmpG